MMQPAFTTIRPQPALRTVQFGCNSAVSPPAFGNASLADNTSPTIQKAAVSSTAPQKPLNPAQQACEWMIKHWYQQNRFIQKFKEKTGLLKCGYTQYGLSEYSCSNYTLEAIKRRGTIKGIWMGFWRIFSCNPISFSKHFQKACTTPFLIP